MSATESSATAGPIESFENCHAGIFRRLQALGTLPALLAPAAFAHEIAESSLEFFREVIFEHHLDEERELFPAVLNAADKGEERGRVEVLVARLTQEHRELEQLWKRLESGLKRAVKGQFDQVDGQDIERLVAAYTAHARFEEAEFLPLSRQILSRRSEQMGDLAMDIHRRHASGQAGRTL
jgi:hemerythrin-like domain-containing protein